MIFLTSNVVSFASVYKPRYKHVRLSVGFDTIYNNIIIGLLDHTHTHTHTSGCTLTRRSTYKVGVRTDPKCPAT